MKISPNLFSFTKFFSFGISWLLFL
ncbi:hypothetical protein XFF6991_4900 [Xanthomonas phaseoli pv. phaseoli]|uniref:Uncharacterized protein n=1 Tax=Xanthomonas campestris pv. phaseoli TaxID=317013 RepID=A0A7Z7J6L4_XANCH|nr:hypothetical protein XFF6991_4900 [Xanthomonas phaseoli pv. phaseoli]